MSLTVVNKIMQNLYNLFHLFAIIETRLSIEYNILPMEFNMKVQYESSAFFKLRKIDYLKYTKFSNKYKLAR